MTKKILLVFLLIASLLLSGCSLVMKDQAVDNKLTILEINGEIINKQAFTNVYEYNVYMEEYYNSMLASMFGTSNPVDTNAILETTISEYVTAIVTAQKAEELGFDKFTAEEEAEIAAAAQTEYESNLAMIKDMYFAGVEMGEEELNAEVEKYAQSNGLTLEQAIASMRSNKINERLMNSVTDLVTEVDDAAIQALLDSKIADEKSKYATSLSVWGASNNNGTATYYTPAGYRTIRVIEMEKTEETAQAVSDEISTLHARIANGEAFEAVSENVKTYVVCKTSTDIDSNLVVAAMTLDAPGAVTSVVETASGYAIAQYVEDIAEASATLAEVRDQLYDETLATAKNDAYTQAVAQWEKEADVKIYRENLSL